MIGASIHFHRMRMGLSQGALGRAIGVTFEQIQKDENIKNSVAASQLVRAGQTSRVKISTLFEKPGPNLWRMKS